MQQRPTLTLASEAGGASSSSSTSQEVVCRSCLSPFDFVEFLRTLVPQDRPDAHEILTEASHRFMLYLGHVHRVKAQQLAQRRAMGTIKSERLHNRVVIVVDWKMKFEPLRFRENTVDFYGEKGLSWHGAAVYYLDPENSEDVVLGNEFQMLFMDHIMKDDTTEDWQAVASSLEAMLKRIKSELPYVTKAVLVSDNAGCYNNNTLPIVLPYVFMANGIMLKSFLHGETCDGKGPCDAHFSIAMSKVWDFVRLGADVCTASSIVVAINAENGLANTIAEVIIPDRTSSAMVHWINMEKENKKRVRSIGRASEIVYTPEGENQFQMTAWKQSIYSKPRTLRITRHGLLPNQGLEASIHTASIEDDDHETDTESPEFQYGDEDSDLEDDGDVDVESALISQGQQQELPSTSAVTSLLSAGIETGVTVLSPGSLRRSGLRLQRLKRKKLQTSAAGSSNQQLGHDCDIAEDDSRTRGIAGSLRKCPQCAALFISKSRYTQHISACVGAAEKIDTLGRAVLEPSRVLKLPDCGISTVQNIMEGVKLHNATFTVPAVTLGWTELPKQGQRYDKTYLERFESELQVYFDEEEADKGKKISSAIMFERLNKEQGLS